MIFHFLKHVSSANYLWYVELIILVIIVIIVIIVVCNVVLLKLCLSTFFSDHYRRTAFVYNLYIQLVICIL